MSSLENTLTKLKHTSSKGAEVHNTQAFRKLASAGYKGFLQGMLGGASLYGLFGLAIGGLVAVPLSATVMGTSAFLFAPAVAFWGMLKGVDTFGQIGSTAAIVAQSDDTSEQRQILIDRLREVPAGPEGERETKAIEEELASLSADHATPPPLFHWKTVLIGAAIGAAIAVGIFWAVGPVGVTAALTKLVAALNLPIEAGVIAQISPFLLGTAGAIGGGAAGATIGIDRYYIRKWFDFTQNIVQPSDQHDQGILELQHKLHHLTTAAKADEKTRQQLAANVTGDTTPPSEKKEEKPASSPVAPNLDTSTQTSASATPPNIISDTRQLDGLTKIHEAMKNPAI